MINAEHNSGRLDFQKWKDPNLRPLPKLILSSEDDFIERAGEIYPKRDDVVFPVEDSVQSKLRERLENLQ